MHESLLLGNPTSWLSFGCFVFACFSVCVCLLLVLCLFVWFVWVCLFFCLWFVLCLCFLAGIAYWTAYRFITSTFVAIDLKPWRRWTEKKAKVQLFQGRKHNLLVFFSQFQKLHLCTPGFSLDAKKQQLTALLFRLKWKDWNLRTISQIWARSPTPSKQWLRKMR